MNVYLYYQQAIKTCSSSMSGMFCMNLYSFEQNQHSIPQAVYSIFYAYHQNPLLIKLSRSVYSHNRKGMFLLLVLFSGICPWKEVMKLSFTYSVHLKVLLAADTIESDMHLILYKIYYVVLGWIWLSSSLLHHCLSFNQLVSSELYGPLWPTFQLLIFTGKHPHEYLQSWAKRISLQTLQCSYVISLCSVPM